MKKYFALFTIFTITLLCYTSISYSQSSNNIENFIGMWDCKFSSPGLDKENEQMNIVLTNDYIKIFNNDKQFMNSQYKILSEKGNNIIIRSRINNNIFIQIIEKTNDDEFILTQLGSYDGTNFQCKLIKKDNKNINEQVTKTNPNLIDRKKREEICNNKVLNNLLSSEEYNYRLSPYDTFGDFICKAKISKGWVSFKKPVTFNKNYELIMNLSGGKVVIKFNPDQNTDYVKKSKMITKKSSNYNYGNEKFMNFEVIGKEKLTPDSIIDTATLLGGIDLMIQMEGKKDNAESWDIFAVNPSGTNN